MAIEEKDVREVWRSGVWVVGTLVLMAIGVVAILLAGRTPRAAPSSSPWDIPSLSGTYTNIVGTLAGFSVASAIFIAGFESTGTSPLFSTVIGMLLVAFLILVFSALAYASIPNAVLSGDNVGFQTLSHLLANTCGCLGLTISWLALVPLLEMLELPELASIFAWVLLIVGIAASGWTALFAYRLTTASAAACSAISVIGFTLAAVYRLALVRVWPALWPSSDAALVFAFVALGVAGLIFGLHVVLLAVFGNTHVARRLGQDGYRIVLAYSVIYTMAVTLLWFAVAIG